ncbi:unnamed protein product [Owenia fusiformis]|uniref:Uncharacterized protein n=2 Tax=Owenia fusiformis TaxID=6347 RepID=A0A8J1TSW6_OWEFU|nr:unnamed protein product [Owenia fusiformis]
MAQRIVLQIIIDWICLLIVSVPILVFKLAGKPFKRGFFCDDESIMHPFRDSTISTVTLFVVGLGLPPVCILITEGYYVLMRKRQGEEFKYFQIGKFNIHPYVWVCYKQIGVFFFGAATSQLTTDIAKYTIGRLRPHFIDICKPNYSLVPGYTGDCTTLGYIERDICEGTDTNLMKEMRLSFMSGHASFSAYTMIYLVLYIHARWQWKGQKLLRPFLQVVILYMTYYTCLSRISDYKHHWSDVLMGFIQGLAVAVLVAQYVSDLFKKEKIWDLIERVQTTTKPHKIVAANGDAVQDGDVSTGTEVVYMTKV